jgi:hypothetical protein
MKASRIHSILQNPKKCWLCNKKTFKSKVQYIVFNTHAKSFFSEQNVICYYCSSFYFYKSKNKISIYFNKNNISYSICIFQKDQSILYSMDSRHDQNYILYDSLDINSFKKIDFKSKVLKTIKKYEENLIFQ